MISKVDEILNSLDFEDIKNEYRLMLKEYKKELDKLDYEKLLWNK